MNELQLFNHDTFGQVRIIKKGDQPWFVAADVCAALDLSDTSKTVSYLDEDEKGTITNRTPGGNQEMLIINEPGLYSLVLRSRKPEAKAFKRWICHEVIPSIRKHGLYATPQTVEAMLADPDTAIRLLTELKAERAKITVLEAKVEADRPKVLFTESVEAASNSILIGAYAGLLRQNGLPMGQNRLFARFREDGWLNKNGERRNMPTQKAMEMGLFEIKERTVNNPDGTIRTTLTPKLTGKGQVYFMSRLLNGAA